MSEKILEFHQDTKVVWIFDADAENHYSEATLIYNVNHVRALNSGTYEIYGGNGLISLQFGVRDVRERK